MATTDEPLPLPPPGELTTVERGLWADLTAGPVPYTAADRPALMLACGWLATALRLRRAAEDAPANLGLVAAAVSASATALKLSAAVGATAIGRKKLGVEIKPPAKKVIGRPRTSLDDLTPEKLMSADELERYRGIREGGPQLSKR